MTENKNIIYFLYFFTFLALWLWFFRIYGFLSNPVPLWYDPGLYRMLFVEYAGNLPNINFTNLSPWVVWTYPPLLGFLSNILIIIGFSPDFLLNYGIWILSLLTCFFLYFISKKMLWRNAAILAVIIFCISITQYQVFWWNYFKQSLWVILMLSAFYTLLQRKYILSFPIILAIFTLHRPTGVFFLATYILYNIIQYFQYKKYDLLNIFTILGAWFIAILMYIPFWDTLIVPLIAPLTSTIMNDSRSWTFLLKDEFGFYNIFIILPSIYGLYSKFTKREFDIITVWYITWMLWVWLRLFFYNRMYIFFDIFIILLAAYGFSELYKQRKKVFYYVFVSFFVIQSLFYTWYIYFKWQAIIAPQEFEFIKKIPTIIEEDSIVMVWSSRYSPWISGYVTSEVIAPWLFHIDSWENEDWQIWWRSTPEEKCTMIQETYNHIKNPLYIYMWERQKREIWHEIETWSCFNIIATDNVAKLLQISFK